MFPLVLVGLGLALVASMSEKKPETSSPLTPPSPPPGPPSPPSPGGGVSIPPTTDPGGLWSQISQGLSQGVGQGVKQVTDLFTPGTLPGIPGPSAPSQPSGVLAPTKWDACFDANMTPANRSMAVAMLDQAEAAARANNPLLTDYFLRTADAFASDFPLFAECLKRVASNIEVVE